LDYSEVKGVSEMNIKKAIDSFVQGKQKNKGKQPNERYASFDYCYNYFYGFYEKNKLDQLASKERLHESCLQIGFYLASWGMMRGSSFLLEKSARNFKPLIVAISKMDRKLWEIDVDSYNDENIQLLIKCKEEIINALGKENNPSDTLITKIMLGVFGTVPAYDQYFRKSFKVYKFNKKSLIKIKQFYEDNKEIFDSYDLRTFDFITGEETKHKYSIAKLVDMCGFMDGQ